MAFSPAKIDRLLNAIQSKSSFIGQNAKLIDILEGNLLPHVKEALQKQLGAEAYKAAEQRIPPINVLQQVNDKLSTIYENGVQREVAGPGDDTPESDEATLSYFIDAMKPDTMFSEANRFYNLNKGVLIQPYLSTANPREVKPAIRVIPYDRFLPYSCNPNEPEAATGYILYMGEEARSSGKRSRMGKVAIFCAIEADEVSWFTGDGEDVTAEKMPDNPEGRNDLGRIPLVYVNQSLTKIVPTPDSDILAMTILLPVLLTDVNFGSAFQSFGIIYTVNTKTGTLQFGPGAVWHFQQEPNDERKPEVGTLKADCDLDSMLNSAANQYALWLQTKGIKPGDVGQISASNFSSGIAKMLDEMDTSSNRKKQVPLFGDAEREFWDIVLHSLLPVWQRDPRFKFKGGFSATSFVETHYPEQVPLQRRGQIVEDTKKEQDAGYLDYRGAMKRLNPTLTDRQIDALIERIEEDKKDAQGNEPEPVALNAVAALVDDAGGSQGSPGSMAPEPA